MVSTPFGNGAPAEAYRLIDLSRAAALARWFLVLRPRPAASTAMPAPDPEFEDPTNSLDTRLRRSPSGSFLGVSDVPRYVFRVKRAPRSRFDFVSVGRNEGNDVVLPDASVSRFHAFLRELPDGSLVVQDVRSANGTFVGGQPVPKQGEGAPLPVRSGEAIRFGDIHGVIVDAAGLAALSKSL
ncbi:MAG: FHA domain-containing protein [Deltaproteobacteria bacterium]|nr:FHA domain-containing protein [Deltaproteobacteria bacterium]